jgi:hypothetical protein
VDIPNACCSLYLHTAIFGFDITPSAAGPIRADAAAAPSRHESDPAVEHGVGGAHPLRRYYAGGPQVQPTSSRRRNVCAVVHADPGYLDA